jgi:uncharacterized protein YndB with AHSA1/START domain
MPTALFDEFQFVLWYSVTSAMGPRYRGLAHRVGRVREVLGSIRHETRIRRSADEVWQLVGDAARLYEWFPGITSSPVDGTSRMITTDAGLPMPEEILVVDPVQRRFQYRLTSPMFQHHRGTIDVIDLGVDHDTPTCLVVYSTEADPRAMALVIGGGTAGALDELRRLMETSAPELPADHHASGPT